MSKCTECSSELTPGEGGNYNAERTPERLIELSWADAEMSVKGAVEERLSDLGKLGYRVVGCNDYCVLLERKNLSLDDTSPWEFHPLMKRLRKKEMVNETSNK